MKKYKIIFKRSFLYPLVTSTTTTLPYEFNNALILSQAPKIGETAELTFTVDVIKLDESHLEEGLARSRAWIDFYWTNTKGSFSEAYSAVQIPAEEVLVNGELSWEGSYEDMIHLYMIQKSCSFCSLST